MAVETKKYVSLDKLTKYDTKIKGVISAGDEATLAAAKAHAEGLASNYDAAGAAATAEKNAKDYTDTEVAKANSAAATAQGAAEAAQAAAEAADGKAVAAQAAADKAQGEVDALETLVGTIPVDEGGNAVAASVVAYVDKKTEGIATDAALGQLQTNLDKAEAAIEAIQKDYLVEQDKTDLQGSIDGVGAKVTTLIGEDANKSVRTIANEELVAQIIPEAAKESLDTLAEIAAWIQSHPDDASAMSKAIEDLEALVGTLPEGIDQTTVVAYVQALVAQEAADRAGAVSGLDERLQVVEGAVGESGSVADDIAAAKQAAIDAAAADATAKAGAAETAAKGYTDTEIAKDRARLDALEAIDHEHANKAVIDGITAEKVAGWDDAAGKAHEHANKTVIDGITADNVTTWNTVTSKAAQADLEAAVTRIAANEAAIAAFEEVSEAEINALFA